MWLKCFTEVDDDFGLSEGESSEEEGKGIYAYCRESRYSSMDLVSFHEVALSRPAQRDRSTATLCSKTGSSDDEEEQEQLISKLCMLAVADQKGGFRYACSLWPTKQQHEHTHNFLNRQYVL